MASEAARVVAAAETISKDESPESFTLRGEDVDADKRAFRVSCMRFEDAESVLKSFPYREELQEVGEDTNIYSWRDHIIVT
jgi:hypothetical protein